MLTIQSWLRRSTVAAFGLGLGVTVHGGCKEVKDEVEDTFGTDVRGRITDDKGQPIEGATVRLYSLLDNTNFVEGSDVGSGEAYIDREAVLASTNSVETAQSGADGSYKMTTLPSAFLAVATKEGCSAGFAGFDEETGVLSFDTLIKPKIDGAVQFEIPTFVLACATPPPTTGPEGNTPDAPPFDPPVSQPPPCDATACAAAGGTCQGTTCAITCVPADCAAAGGTCTNGACATPTCDAAACVAAGGACSPDGATCQLPKCDSNEDCQAVQPGWVCVNPGDVALAACQAPPPGEIPAPPEVKGWTLLRLTDTAGALVADASAGEQAIVASAVPENNLVRLYAQYQGSATRGYIMVQSGSADCAEAPPRTDYIAIDLSNNQVATAKGDFVELYLHKGFQKI
ncbi:MAG TPA: carboxypeptidase-like regulatory domain-containing protein, partial [Polyangiaceae bacterium]|nr:carboxypeptidase-like regulatory domain-containing protein [Polyangiaceae bacterium]